MARPTVARPIHLDAPSVLRHVARRHHLPPAPPAGDPAALVERLVALHATDPATVHLSVHVRCGHETLEETARALTAAIEDERTLVRTIGMRRTLHVVSAALTPTIRAIYRDRLSKQTLRDCGRLLAGAGICEADEATAEMEKLEARVLAALADGPATTTALGAGMPQLKASFEYKPEKPYGGKMVIGGRLMNALGILGGIVRAHNQGGWRSGTYSWARLDHWLPDLPPPPASEILIPALVRSYLGAFGPASAEDIPWWTGLPKGMIKTALAALGSEVTEVEVAGWPPQWMLAADLETFREPAPPVAGAALLPALDPTIMGYKERQRFLDPAWTAELFDRNGNAGSTVWWDGRVIGGWAQRKDSSVVYRLLADEPEAEGVVREAAAALEAALGEERVMPRFPVPLSKSLVA